MEKKYLGVGKQSEIHKFGHFCKVEELKGKIAHKWTRIGWLLLNIF
tara:strand:- start:501 stop:638 length:138 start_codon:yes stop_codon:yes gene_type:complete